MRILPPFIPLRVSTQDLCHKVDVLGRSYTFGADGLLKSVLVGGQELLAGPVRVVMEEDGAPSVFDTNYSENESESFIHSRSDEKTIICGCKQSERFILDFCSTVSYDGNIDIDIKLMPRGKTVAQVFGLSAVKPLRYKLDKLWLEIPMKKEIAQMYNLCPNGDVYLADGSVIKEASTTTSGRVPAEDAHMPFKACFWLGDDEKGLGYMAENERGRCVADENYATQLVHEDDAVVLRIRLLDAPPEEWRAPLEDGAYEYTAVAFTFALMATPVKPFPKNPYIHKAFHLDCGIKIKGNYGDFLSENGRFDRLVEKGVDTLILHEKWNKTQNWFELSEYTAAQLRFIVDECHRRGIKVLVYFGYEFSTMAPEWTQFNEQIVSRLDSGRRAGGWWRVPFQRAYRACHKSDMYTDLLVDGISKVMDDFNIDGVYLDGTAWPWFCCNTEHGCGWYDSKGNLRGSYPLHSVRRTFMRLSAAVKQRGGTINLHCSTVLHYGAWPYIDQLWTGELLQADFSKGNTEDLPLDYFRAEFSGRNMGVPVEFIAYENRPYWNFENAFACSILNGLLPRPNDIEHPLEMMSEIWKVIDAFPIEKAQWLAYYANNITVSHEKVKVGYYKYTDLGGKDSLLVFASNICATPAEGVTLKFEENVSALTDALTGEAAERFDVAPYTCRVLFAQ